MEFLTLVLISVFVAAFGVGYSRRREVAVWVLEKCLRITASKTGGVPDATLERRHLRVNFIYQGNPYTIFLPMNNREGRGYKWDTTIYTGDDGGAIQFNHPAGVKFPTTAAALGVNSIQRLSIDGTAKMFLGTDPVP